jgi:predicted MFS family arabinose efflux permease
LYVLPVVQLLHGFNFALYWAAAVDAIHKLSPKELTTTSMAALNVAYATFGAAVGSFLWGYVYDSYGGVKSVYNCSALLLICTIAVLSGSRSLLNSANFTHLAGEIGSKTAGSTSSSIHVSVASPHVHKDKDEGALTL